MKRKSDDDLLLKCAQHYAKKEAQLSAVSVPTKPVIRDLSSQPMDNRISEKRKRLL